MLLPIRFVTTMFALFLSVFIGCLSATEGAHAESLVLNTSWQAEHETFAAWYAKERGWDKAADMKLNLPNAAKMAKMTLYFCLLSMGCAKVGEEVANTC